MSDETTGLYRIILVPSLITLGVTLLRLIGELMHWPALFFSREAGGGGAIVGIAWVAFVFALYFAVQLQKTEQGIENSGRAIGLAFLSLAILVGGMFLFVTAAQQQNIPILLGSLVVCLISLGVMRLSWAAYWKVMLAYALAARIPVILVMFFAIRGDWGTHYDVLPPGTPEFSSWFERFQWIGLVPQLFLWVPYTVVMCGLFGVLFAAARKKRLGAQPAAT